MTTRGLYHDRPACPLGPRPAPYGCLCEAGHPETGTLCLERARVIVPLPGVELGEIYLCGEHSE